MPTFKPERSIFKNHDVLDEEWTPEEIQGRDKEINQYTECLQPVINGWQPKNIFLYGKTGVGKTVVTESLLNDLERDAQEWDVNITVVKITCSNQTTSYQVAIRLLNELYLQRGKATIAETGYAQQDVFNKLWDELDDVGGTILLVMDEIDNVEDPDDILYQIPRARKNGNIENARLGIIAIANDYSFTENLSPKAKSTLRETELHFSAYDSSELQDILEHRAAKAFHEGAIEGDVIPLCAALAANQAGDARMAMDLLLEAGEAAVSDGADAVTAEYIRDAQERMESDWILEALKGVSTQEHLALASVISKACEGDSPVRTSELYKRYESLCEGMGRDPLSQKATRDNLNELAFQNVLNKYEQNKGQEGGRYFEFELDTDLEAMLTAAYEVDSVVFDDEFINEWVKRGLRARSVEEGRLEFLDQEAIDSLKQRL
jgi:cell division control protein 6